MNDAVRKKDDGGPAFPVAWSDGDGNAVAVPGMTLRDYFAGQVLHGIVSGPGAHDVAARDERYDESNWAQVVALNCYEFADAMLLARSPSEQHPETQG